MKDGYADTPKEMAHLLSLHLPKIKEMRNSFTRHVGHCSDFDDTVRAIEKQINVLELWGTSIRSVDCSRLAAYAAGVEE